jgi:hypothetical protein
MVGRGSCHPASQRQRRFSSRRRRLEVMVPPSGQSAPTPSQPGKIGSRLDDRSGAGRRGAEMTTFGPGRDAAGGDAKRGAAGRSTWPAPGCDARPRRSAVAWRRSGRAGWACGGPAMPSSRSPRASRLGRGWKTRCPPSGRSHALVVGAARDRGFRRPQVPSGATLINDDPDHLEPGKRALLSGGPPEQGHAEGTDRLVLAGSMPWRLWPPSGRGLLSRLRGRRHMPLFGKV